jgi:hypothetical protein
LRWPTGRCEDGGPRRRRLGRAACQSAPPAPQLGDLLEYRDWETGTPGTLLVSTQLSIAEIYDRIASGHGLIGNRSFGQALLLVLLVVVGGLFLVIEGVALVVGLALAKSITGSVHELFTGTERVPGRFHAQDRRQGARSAGRAGRVVQLDDRKHRGSAAAGGREETARGGAADRA